MGWKAAQKLIHHWKIIRGDNVMITRGKDKGEIGLVKRVIRSQNRVLVEGKNLVKKHIKQGQGHEGGIFSVEAPLHVSNVQVLDPVTGKPCKVGTKYLEDGTKVRVSRGIGASGSIIPRPEILKIRSTPRPTIVGPKDTPMELVLEKTYDAKTGKGMPVFDPTCLFRKRKPVAGDRSNGFFSGSLLRTDFLLDLLYRWFVEFMEIFASYAA